MARERMVTRTVEMTNAEFMTLRIDTAEVANLNVEIPGNLTPVQCLEWVRKHIEPKDPLLKYVVCNSVRTYEALYGMPESEFIQRAKVLPPRTASN